MTLAPTRVLQTLRVFNFIKMHRAQLLVRVLPCVAALEGDDAHSLAVVAGALLPLASVAGDGAAPPFKASGTFTSSLIRESGLNHRHCLMSVRRARHKETPP